MSCSQANVEPLRTVSSRASYIAAATPVIGTAFLVGLAFAQLRWFDAVVREDSVLEWAEVAAYGAVAVIGALVAYRVRGFVGLAYALLAVAAVGAVGEELSWGQ